MRRNACEILRGCRTFTGVSAAAWDRLAQIAVVQEFAGGQIIARQGGAAPGMFVLDSGLVKVFMLAPGGKEHTLHLVGPGGTFLEVAAMGDIPCPANSLALEDTRAVLLPAQALRGALKADHDLCLQLISGMALWVKRLVDLTEDLALRDAAGRVARYLLREAGAASTVRLLSSRKDLASHLNLTSETLSRTFRRLSEANLISDNGNDGIDLLDLPTLTAVAEGEFPRL